MKHTGSIPFTEEREEQQTQWPAREAASPGGGQETEAEDVTGERNGKAGFGGTYFNTNVAGHGGKSEIGAGSGQGTAPGKGKMKKLYIIAGCNGAGKTTASYTVLPEMLSCKEFVNADEIAKGLSPFNPANVTLEAGRLMLTRVKELLEEGVDFAFETTLSTRSYVSLIRKAHDLGYHVTMVYFWLNSPQLAVDRVELRVASGGHAIEQHVIYRRYTKGLQNLFRMYIPVTDYWIIVDNSFLKFDIIAEGERDKIKTITNPLSYKSMQNL